MDRNMPTMENYSPQELTEMLKSGLQSLSEKFAQQASLLTEREARIRELEKEVESLRNDPWTTRVTYDSVVEQIASYEDPSQRDEARKLIEPLLKKEQVRQLRRDIRKKVKELEAAEEPAEEMLPEVPEELQTAEAEEIWAGLREAGFILEGSYGLAKDVSANQATYIADRMADRLGITLKWKMFQKLWGIRNMAQLAGSWKETGKLPPRADEIDELM